MYILHLGGNVRTESSPISLPSPLLQAGGGGAGLFSELSCIVLFFSSNKLNTRRTSKKSCIIKELLSV